MPATPDSSYSLTCDHVMNMVGANVPASAIAGVVRGGAGPYDRDTYDCLTGRSAPELVLREYRAFVDVVKPLGLSALKGTAWDALGQPLGDVRVVLRHTAIPDVGWFEVTDADGRFEVRNLPAGTYSVFLESRESAWLARISLPDAITLEITPVLGLGDGPESLLGR